MPLEVCLTEDFMAPHAHAGTGSGHTCVTSRAEDQAPWGQATDPCFSLFPPVDGTSAPAWLGY